MRPAKVVSWWVEIATRRGRKAQARAAGVGPGRKGDRARPPALRSGATARGELDGSSGQVQKTSRGGANLAKLSLELQLEHNLNELDSLDSLWGRGGAGQRQGGEGSRGEGQRGYKWGLHRLKLRLVKPLRLVDGGLVLPLIALPEMSERVSE